MGGEVQGMDSSDQQESHRTNTRAEREARRRPGQRKTRKERTKSRDQRGSPPRTGGSKRTARGNKGIDKADGRNTGPPLPKRATD